MYKNTKNCKHNILETWVKGVGEHQLCGGQQVKSFSTSGQPISLQ